jgi:UDP-N-acetylmuramate dehydrogenase
MNIRNDISLKSYNTFGLDYHARCLVTLDDEQEASHLFSSKHSFPSPLFILGGGSNLLFTGNFTGTLIQPLFGGIKIEKEQGNEVVVSVGAGIKWDDLVSLTVEKGLYGLENLSLIPGTVGASPVQNIGAYGTEVKDIIEKVGTISTVDGSARTFSIDECEFGYRYSAFKGKYKGKFLVTRVFFRLSANPCLNLEYGPVKEEIRRLGSESLANVRQAVINIRRSKLPDPVVTGNAGSFFKNPAVTENEASELKRKYPGIPLYPDRKGMVKIPAGWLIERCGWKGKRLGNAGVHEKQALVIVNYGNASGEEIYHLSEMISKSVQDEFGISLEREVEVICPI